MSLKVWYHCIFTRIYQQCSLPISQWISEGIWINFSRLTFQRNPLQSVVQFMLHPGTNLCDSWSMIHDEVPQVPSASSHKVFFDAWKVATAHRSTPRNAASIRASQRGGGERGSDVHSFHSTKGGKGERAGWQTQGSAEKALPSRLTTKMDFDYSIE